MLSLLRPWGCSTRNFSKNCSPALSDRPLGYQASAKLCQFLPDQHLLGGPALLSRSHSWTVSYSFSLQGVGGSSVRLFAGSVDLWPCEQSLVRACTSLTSCRHLCCDCMAQCLVLSGVAREWRKSRNPAGSGGLCTLWWCGTNCYSDLEPQCVYYSTAGGDRESQWEASVTAVSRWRVAGFCTHCPVVRKHSCLDQRKLCHSSPDPYWDGFAFPTHVLRHWFLMWLCQVHSIHSLRDSATFYTLRAS